MKYRIKLVPDAEPNADGEWKEIEVDAEWWKIAGYREQPVGWRYMEEFLRRFAPDGFHIVALVTVSTDTLRVAAEVPRVAAGAAPVRSLILDGEFLTLTRRDIERRLIFD